MLSKGRNAAPLMTEEEKENVEMPIPLEYFCRPKTFNLVKDLP